MGHGLNIVGGIHAKWKSLRGHTKGVWPFLSWAEKTGDDCCRVVVVEASSSCEFLHKATGTLDWAQSWEEEFTVKKKKKKRERKFSHYLLTSMLMEKAGEVWSSTKHFWHFLTRIFYSGDKKSWIWLQFLTQMFEMWLSQTGFVVPCGKESSVLSFKTLGE